MSSLPLLRSTLCEVTRRYFTTVQKHKHRMTRHSRVKANTMPRTDLDPDVSSEAAEKKNQTLTIRSDSGDIKHQHLFQKF